MDAHYISLLQTGIMSEYPVMSTSQGTYVRIEQTSEVIRVTYEMCRVGGGGAGARELELRTADLVRRTKISLLKNQGHTAHRDSRLACSLSLDLWLFAFDCAKKCSQP